MNINDFKTLLLNRNEIEKILGRAITAESSGGDYLDDYRLFPELSLHDVTCLLLGLHPKDWEDWNAYQNHRYEVIKEAIQQSAKSGHIQARIEKDTYGNVGNIFLTHEVAEKWAQTHGLKWNIPPYRKPSEDAEGNNQAIELENLSKPVIDSTELQEEEAKNAQLQAEIERLKAENAELKAQLQDNAQRQSAVGYDDFSIYGHKSELLEILFKVTAEFWAGSETPPKNSVIEQWIETNYPVKNYPYVSKAVRQYIATILRPQPKLK